MKEYFGSLFIVAVCAAVGQLICENADVKKSGVYSGIRLICSLCICLTVLSFFISGDTISEALKILDGSSGDIAAFSDSQTADGGTLIEETKKELESTLCSLIYEKTGIKPVYAGIKFNVQQTDSGKEIAFSGAEIAFPRDATEDILYFTELFTEGILGCDVTVKREGRIAIWPS